jgi:hypothetical protein
MGRGLLSALTVAGILIVTPSTSGSTAAARVDPLQGSWETSSVPVRQMHDVLVRAGSSEAEVKSFFKFFGMRNAWRNRLVFYRESNVPFLAMSGWDPTRHSGPADADHGPYKLLSGRRFVARGVDPPTDRVRELFSYAATTERLKLRFISLKEPYPQFSREDLVRDTMLMRIVAAFPYRRTG